MAEAAEPVANYLLDALGTEEYNNFNKFSEKVDEVLKAQKEKLSAGEKKAILDAVSWYDAEAKVLKGILKLKDEKLEVLLDRLACEEAQLPDFGYYPSGKKGEYLVYETESDLQDSRTCR